MLAYAFSLLREEKMEELCDSEAFVNTADLLSTILESGVKKLIKRGLNKAYIEEKDSLNCLRVIASSTSNKPASSASLMVLSKSEYKKSLK